MKQKLASTSFLRTKYEGSSERKVARFSDTIRCGRLEKDCEGCDCDKIGDVHRSLLRRNRTHIRTPAQIYWNSYTSICLLIGYTSYFCLLSKRPSFCQRFRYTVLKFCSVPYWRYSFYCNKIFVLKRALRIWFVKKCSFLRSLFKVDSLFPCYNYLHGPGGLCGGLSNRRRERTEELT